MLSRRRFAITLGAGLVAGPLRAEDRPLPARNRFEIYLLLGQSNMAGRGRLDDEARTPPVRVLKFNEAKKWVPGVDPLHFDRPAIVGVGLGSSFARVLADADPEIAVGLVPCAVGGSRLEAWSRGGEHYRQALVRGRAAAADGTLKGILWHQGENDALLETDARTWGDRLARMIGDLREDLGAGELPFVAGKLGEFLARTQADGKEMYWPLINRHLDALPGRVPRVAVVESHGLKDQGDGVHFDTPSLREFGRRYAAALRRLRTE